MASVFNGATSFNRDLSSWDVSSVTNMGFMFSGASSFNQNISEWDTRDATNMKKSSIVATILTRICLSGMYPM